MFASPLSRAEWNKPGKDLDTFAELSSITRQPVAGQKNARTFVTDHPSDLNKSINPADVEWIGNWKPMDWMDTPEPWFYRTAYGFAADINTNEKPGNGHRLKILSLKDHSDTRWRSMGTPLAPLTLLGILSEAGYTVHIQDIDQHVHRVHFKDRPSAVLISVYEDQYPDVQAIVKWISDAYSAPVILGGPMATLAPLHTIAHCPGVSALFRGEVENILVPFMNSFLPIEEIDLSGILRLSGIRGMYFRFPGGSVMSSLDCVSEIESDAIRNPGTAWLNQTDLHNGLEFSTSRGCHRACTFCSHVHGRTVRNASLKQIDQDLKTASEMLSTISSGKSGTRYFSININDDDILMDPNRAINILEICRKYRFRVWGIQTSIESLKKTDVRAQIFQAFASNDYFVDGKVILWIGTDAFIDQRRRRLGKTGTSRDISAVCRDIHRFGFLGYHYWIMTDADSDWMEFIDELRVLGHLKTMCGDSFNVLPNAATLVPYPSTPVYRRRIARKQTNRIVLKAWLSIPGLSALDYPLVSHERPVDDYLYALVEPRAAAAERIVADPWRCIDHVRAGRFNDAVMESLAVLSLKLRDMEAGSRRNELEALKRCIMEQWYL